MGKLISLIYTTEQRLKTSKISVIFQEESDKLNACRLDQSSRLQSPEAPADGGQAFEGPSRFRYWITFSITL